MLPRTIFNIVRRTICTNRQIFYALENTANLNSKLCSLYVNSTYSQQNLISIIFKRFKSKGKVTKQHKVDKDEYEDEDEDENEDEIDFDVENYVDTPRSKVIKTTIPSLRLDACAKTGLGISRAKVDKEFYKGNLRLNGMKCLKKNILVKVGDTIDYIQGRSPTTSDYLIVNRCVLASVNVDQEEGVIKVKLLINKSLVIEDYDNNYHSNN